MNFVSLQYALFLPVVILLSWGVGARRRLQNLLLVGAGLWFYASLDWRFPCLLLVTATANYLAALELGHSRRRRTRRWQLGGAVLISLGMLGVFKYHGFFAENLHLALAHLGFTPGTWTLKLILPVGISFYTFQNLGYAIDVYRGRLRPVRDPLDYAAFVTFFPVLLAGPIQRGGDLLPQFARARIFDEGAAVDGLRQLLWGLFKKAVVADNCAIAVKPIFATAGAQTGSSLVMGAVLFSVQIYADFSGYSDMAIGSARLLGFDLKRNFACPYFARNIGEFWRRWHISLSTWFRDYLYIPLGGSRCSTARRIGNILVVFLVSGLWHGAAWTFVIWGGIHALCLLPLLLGGANRRWLDGVAAGRLLPRWDEAWRMALTFGVVTLAWIFFRAESLGHAGSYLRGMVAADVLSVPANLQLQLLAFILLMVVVEWLQRERAHGLEALQRNLPRVLRWSFYLLLLLLVIYRSGAQQDFIYFGF